MSKMLSSMLLGVFFLVSVFLIILFLTLGAKFFFYSIKQKYLQKPEPPKPEPKKEVKKRKPVKSIVIDPDDVDRIYVKKSS